MSKSLEKRVAALEEQVAKLEQRLKSVDSTDRAWLDNWYGKFADDPVFAEAMRFGREYGKSHRPRSETSRNRARRSSYNLNDLLRQYTAVPKELDFPPMGNELV